MMGIECILCWHDKPMWWFIDYFEKKNLFMLVFDEKISNAYFIEVELLQINQNNGILKVYNNKKNIK